ncbi:MAG: hypothetical protein JW822_00920 [Spirochaetales bacterium]|nr:hypothetical protein [Spirochaetales bacterium]
MNKNLDFTVELQIDVGRNILNFKKLVDLKNSPGWIVGRETIKEWYFSGFSSRDNKFYVSGPVAPGISLADILVLPAERAFTSMVLLTKACEKLLEHSSTPFELQLDTVYFLENNEILFLPPDIVRKAREFNPESYRFSVYSPFNNPYLQDQRSKLSFSLGSLFFRITAGVFPYQGSSVEEINAKMRAFTTVSPILSCPSLKPELADFFKTFFSEQFSYNLSLADWVKMFKKYSKEGVTKQISEQEKAAILEQAKSQADKSGKRFRSHLFFERQGRTILITSLIAIAALLVTGYYVSGFFKPRLTKGFSPAEVVEAFYSSVNKLDPRLMEDCVVDQAGGQELEEINRLYVNTRQQLSLGYSTYIPASEWDRLGKPAIALGQFVYGITDLTITQEEDIPHPVFQVSFSKWIPAQLPEDYQELSFNPQGFRIKELLYLKQDGEDWVIFKRLRLEEEKISAKAQ